MSKKNNVNADHYKVAGRDRPGDDILHAQDKQKVRHAQAAARASAPNVMPGAPSGEQARHSAESAEAEEPVYRQAGLKQAHEKAPASTPEPKSRRS